MSESRSPRNILITGAAAGLGRATAVACAARGARVLLVDSDLRGLEASCAAVEEVGLAPGFCQLDLSAAGPVEMAQLVGQFADAYGTLAGLVHCAARFGGLQPLEQVAPGDWLQTLQVNLNAAWLLTTACLPRLREARQARLLFVLDRIPQGQGAYWGAYAVSKAGLAQLAAGFAAELEGAGIRVHGVDPGPLRTALRARAYHAEDPAAVPDPRAAGAALAELALGLREEPATFVELARSDQAARTSPDSAAS